VAAKARNAEICDLILWTVSNVEFIQLLYGDDDTTSCQDRARILLDLYLNTPDKALNETPLHFAVKFGAVSVVDILVSYPQCKKDAVNKFDQTPRDASNMYFHFLNIVLNNKELRTSSGVLHYMPFKIHIHNI
jgi:hypothetical protein